MKSKIVTAILVLIVSLGSTTGTGAQSPAALASGSGSGMAGDTSISIPVTLNSGATQITGLNFDLTFDSNRLSVSNVSKGSAVPASKTLSYSLPAAGTVRVIIFGLDQTAIANGIVANIVFNVSASASSGTSLLTLGNAAASDPSGAGVALSLSGGSFTVIAPPPTSTPIPPPSDTPVPTSTHTPTATQVPSGNPTQTSTLPATNTSSAPGYASPTLTPTLIATSENTPAITPTIDMTTTSTIEMDMTPTSDEVVSKEMAQSIEMSIMATMTALADVDAQVAATGTALALSAGGSDGANSDSESEGGLVFSNPLMWPAIIAISAGAVALSIFGVRVVRKRRSSR